MNGAPSGREFWRTLKELLASIEEYLSLWCIHRLHAGRSDFRKLFTLHIAPDLATMQRQQDFLYRSSLPAEWISASESDNLKREMWGTWLGREEAYYRECALLVRSFGWMDIAACNDPVIANHAARLQHAHSRLIDRVLPEVLRPGRYRVASWNESVTRMWGYSEYDPVDVPSFVPMVLEYFDGRSTNEVLAQIGQKTDFALTSELVQTLYDFGILIAQPQNLPVIPAKIEE